MTTIHTRSPDILSQCTSSHGRRPQTNMLRRIRDYFQNKTIHLISPLFLPL